MLNDRPANSVREHITSVNAANALDSLVSKSRQTLESILENPEVSIAEKADIALRILEIANTTKQSDRPLIEDKQRSKHQPLTIVSSEKNIHQIDSSESNNTDERSHFFPAQYWQIDNFLSPEEYRQVLNTALGKQQEFKDSQTVTKKDNYRQSSVLPGKHFSDVYYLVKSKILDTLPSVLKQLQHPEFFVSHVEMQMTAHNNGCFYKTHSDAGSAKTKTRELTYVYYFYRKPKQFSGGELKLYDTKMVGNKFTHEENSKIVEPRNNSIVFFNSRCKHEVLTIDCDSGQFPDSRFTLNGWLRR